MNIENMLRALEKIYENRYGGKWTFTAKRRSEYENLETDMRNGDCHNGSNPDLLQPQSVDTGLCADNHLCNHWGDAAHQAGA